jgi:hypothetical protein
VEARVWSRLDEASTLLLVKHPNVGSPWTFSALWRQREPSGDSCGTISPTAALRLVGIDDLQAAVFGGCLSVFLRVPRGSSIRECLIEGYPLQKAVTDVSELHLGADALVGISRYLDHLGADELLVAFYGDADAVFEVDSGGSDGSDAVSGRRTEARTSGRASQRTI